MFQQNVFFIAPTQVKKTTFVCSVKTKGCEWSTLSTKMICYLSFIRCPILLLVGSPPALNAVRSFLSPSNRRTPWVQSMPLHQAWPLLTPELTPLTLHIQWSRKVLQVKPIHIQYKYQYIFHHKVWLLFCWSQVSLTYVTSVRSPPPTSTCCCNTTKAATLSSA